jgi:Tfp pilus assembly protein PilF
VLALCLLGGAGAAAAQPLAPATRFLVMPFEAGRDTQSAWLGEAVAVLLTDVLNGSGAFAFTREERVSAFEYFGILPSALVTRATTLRIARALGASDVIVGRIDVQGPTLTIVARRLSLEQGRFVADTRAEGRLDDLSTAVESLASKARLKGPRATSQTHMAPDAFELYVRGLLSQNLSRQITLFESALATAPKDDRIREALWGAQTDRGNFDLALRAIEGVERSSPHYRLARFMAGLSLVELARLDEAFVVFKSLSEESATGPLLNNVGVLQLRRTPSAYEGGPTYHLTRAAELEPDDPDICFNLGYAYWLEKSPDAAAYWLREAVRRNPADGDAHAVLSLVLQSTGATAESDREWELARLLSERYADTTMRPQSVPRGLERLSMDIEIPRVQSLSMVLREPAGRDQSQVASFHLERGRRFVETARDSEAVQELRKAIYLSPYDAETHLWLGRAQRRLGQVRQAVDAFRVSVWCKDSAEARVELAEVLLELKDVVRAKVEISRALQIDPTSTRARGLQERLAVREP